MIYNEIQHLKVQDKIRNILGPICKLWYTIERSENSVDGDFEVDLQDIKQFIEQTILMIGQASYSVSYYRRFNVLMALTEPSKMSKDMIKNESELLQSSDAKLFGKDFRKHMVETTKSKKQASFEKTIQQALLIRPFPPNTTKEWW